MNNYFNINKPYFNHQFGQDWSDYDTIIDDNVDYVYGKTFDLYRLRDITRMPILAVELALRLRNITTSPEETIDIKKLKLRSFNTDFKSKAMQDTYLDYQEAIVGTRGVVYSGYQLGSFVWDSGCWPIPGSPEPCDWIWSTSSAILDIYIDCKTADSDELDEIVAIYRQPFLLPAFYNIFLINSSFETLRTV